MDEFFEAHLMLKKKEFFNYIDDSMAYLWKDRKHIDYLQKEIYRLYEVKDVTSKYFEEIEERYHILSLLNRAHEELLILDKFNRAVLLMKMKQHRRQVREEEEALALEIKSSLEIIKRYNPDHALSSFCLKDLHKKIRTLVVCRYKYNQIRLFLNRHYRLHPEVAMALIFNPPLPL